MASVPIQFDERGMFLMVGPERTEELRTTLSLAGIEFVEEEPDGAGCAGPVVAVFRVASGVPANALRRALKAR